MKGGRQVMEIETRQRGVRRRWILGGDGCSEAPISTRASV